MTKRDFSPENIHNFIEENESTKVFPTGSYVWFHNKIKDFIPHDYDYVVIEKSDQYNFQRFSYMFMDVFKISINIEGNKKDLINFILGYAESSGKMMSSSALLNPLFCKELNISWTDIDPYYTRIENLLNVAISINPKYSYVLEILKCYAENKNHELSDQQISKVYEVYLKYKGFRKNPTYVEWRLTK